MTFSSLLEELDKFYEEAEEAVEDEDNVETELKDDEDDEIDVTDDPHECVLECTNCSGLIIKDKDELDEAEAEELFCPDDECPYCGETVGYMMRGCLVECPAIAITE